MDKVLLEPGSIKKKQLKQLQPSLGLLTKSMILSIFQLKIIHWVSFLLLAWLILL